MTKEILIPLIEKGLSTYKIAKELNLSNSTIIYWVKSLELSDLYKSISLRDNLKNTINYKYSKEIIEDFAKNSNSLSELLEKFNLVPRGRNFDTIKKYIKLHNIDISHFNINKNRKGIIKERSINSYLHNEFKIGSTALKKKLYKTNLKLRICELCGQDEIWNNKKMSLILDHIDGNSNNNNLNNLRIVCPNCNATLDTHCGKNKRS